MNLRARLRRRRPAGRFRPIPVEPVEGIAPEDQVVIDRVSPFTMTGPARIEALLAATSYVVGNGVPGAFVECGVWRGGSMMAVALRLLELGVTDRDLYLFDTFAGMSEPTAEDVSEYHEPALATWNHAMESGATPWEAILFSSRFDEDSVRQRLHDTGYPAERIHLVRGKVEDTVPAHAPDEIAVLRLDTDWYASTRHEMEHLYPLLKAGGVLIVDDYGHWKGARQAVEEYFADPDRPRPLLHRIDYACRQAVKP